MFNVCFWKVEKSSTEWCEALFFIAKPGKLWSKLKDEWEKQTWMAVSAEKNKLLVYEYEKNDDLLNAKYFMADIQMLQFNG